MTQVPAAELSQAEGAMQISGRLKSPVVLLSMGCCVLDY